jgi:hypothetical protein
MRRLLVTVNFVPSSPILVALMVKALSSFETSVLTRGTRRNIPEDAIVMRFFLYKAVICSDLSKPVSALDLTDVTLTLQFKIHRQSFIG